MIASAQRQGDEDALVARVGVLATLRGRGEVSAAVIGIWWRRPARAMWFPLLPLVSPAYSSGASARSRPRTHRARWPNEAVTEGGKLLPNSRMKAFIDLVKDRPVYLSLSGKTMEFDAIAKCVAGC